MSNNDLGPKKKHTYYAGNGGGGRARRTPEQRQQAAETREIPTGEKKVVRKAGSAKGRRSSDKRTTKAAPGGEGGRQPKNGKRGGNPIATFFKTLTPLKRNLLLGGVAFLLIVVILLVILIPSCGTGTPETSSDLPETSLVTDDSYDRNAFVLDTEKLQGTVLDKTDDAGQEYIDDTVFLGDSNTVRFVNFRTETGATLQNAIGVEGMGIHSLTSLKCVQFQGYSSMVTMPEAVKLLQPRRVVIAFGTNNVGGMKVDTFIEHYRKAIAAIQDAYEYADIIIASVIPVAQRHTNESITMTKIDEYNLALAELADELDVKFLNWSETLRDATTGYAKSEYMATSDGIHITQAAAKAMFDYYRTHAYITEDTRPKPLNDIPTRIQAASTTTSSSSSQVTTSAVATTVTVKYAAGTGGSLTVGGQTYSSYSESVKPGSTGTAVAAKASSGYVFSHWTVSTGGSNLTSSSVSYTVPSGQEVGTTITLTAVFKSTGTSSSTTTTTTTSRVTTTAPTTQPPTTTTAPPTTSKGGNTTTSTPTTKPTPTETPTPSESNSNTSNGGEESQVTSNSVNEGTTTSVTTTPSETPATELTSQQPPEEQEEE